MGASPPAPRRVPQRQGLPATSRASPPPARDTRPCSGAARVQPRGCKGRSPLHKKTKNLPLSRRGRALCERGSGGWGQQSKLKAGAAGDKQGKPPLRIPERQGQPATSRASPPPARDTRPCSGAARVQPRGCKGRSPLHKKTKNLPLPAGKGVGGMGEIK